MSSTLLDVFLSHARQAPERPALDFEQQHFTYGQLAGRVTAFASALQRRGLRPGERLALFLENGPDFVVAYLGTLYAGGVVVLVNTAYRQVELSHILADAGARVCVTGAAGAAELAPLKEQLPALEWLVTAEAPAASGPWPTVGMETLLAEGDGRSALPLPEGEQLAVLGYTSGTTGRSKGAMLRHRNLLANVRAVTEAWR
ncbi:MAG TPA: class I adenylate-forming enzyme family protein, partial [Myxococcaceae bacterium]|nr:class I adenylate-forming enzyme family protein [Myxococcaceae bacterium]